MEFTDPDWFDVEALQSGDDRALDRIIERHRRSLELFMFRMIGHAADAEELTQETFVRVYFQIGSYRPRSRFVAWLYQIARNLCRDYFKSRAYRQRSLNTELTVEIEDNLNSENLPESLAQRIDQVQAALLLIPAALRECLILTAVEGLSHIEAGRRLGLSAKAVEVKSYRARKRLLKMLGNS